MRLFSLHFLHVFDSCLYSASCLCMSIDLKCIDSSIAFMDSMNFKRNHLLS